MREYKSKTFSNDHLTGIENNIKSFVNEEQPSQFSFSVTFCSKSNNTSEKDKFVAVMIYKS